MKVLFIGIGHMGAGMAGNIMRKNGSLTIWNRTKDKPAVAHMTGIGAVFAEDVAAAAKEAEFICFNLTSEVAVGEVANVIADSVSPGSGLMDFSTSSPDGSTQIAKNFKERGAFFLDCPVSGGEVRAKDGTLTMMAGGEREAFDRAMPLLQMCGSIIQYMGTSGMGQKSKLINQLLTGVNQAAVCEAMVLANKIGIDLTALYHIIKTSWGQSWMLERSMEPNIIPRNFGTFGRELIVKDLNFVAAMAEQVGCDIPITLKAKEPYDQAMREGLVKRDPSVITEVMERNNIKK